jgi:membrane fusion protein, multidrug efflux system
MNCTIQCFLIALIAGSFSQTGSAQTVELIPVTARIISRTVDLPGEIQPYLQATLHARVTGFVETVMVDRGSIVKQGDLLAQLSAPEMKAQIAEAESKMRAVEADRVQAEAQVAAAQATLDRMKEAAKTPGAIAGNEIAIVEKQVEANKAVVSSRLQANRAAQASVEALKAMEAYLTITAPFEGVITERLVHPGALVGPNTNSPLLIIEQISRLRLVVAVPEEDVAGIARRAIVSFRVPAYPERVFSGVVARVPKTLDTKTRSMAVELDVVNKDQSLAPGMYPTVRWPVRSSEQGFFVPRTSVVTTTERTFIIREHNGHAEWVNVQKGTVDGDMIRVIGPLKAGDRIVKRASDEIREGTALAAHPN